MIEGEWNTAKGFLFLPPYAELNVIAAVMARNSSIRSLLIPSGVMRQNFVDAVVSGRDTLSTILTVPQLEKTLRKEFEALTGY